MSLHVRLSGRQTGKANSPNGLSTVVLGQRVLQPGKLTTCKWPCASVAGERSPQVCRSEASVSLFPKGSTRIHTTERLRAYKGCLP